MRRRHNNKSIVTDHPLTMLCRVVVITLQKGRLRKPYNNNSQVFVHSSMGHVAQLGLIGLKFDSLIVVQHMLLHGNCHKHTGVFQ